MISDQSFPLEFARIDAANFENAWGPADFRPGPDRLMFSLWRDDACVCFLYASTIVGESELLRIATDPAHRRKGAASLLMTRYLEVAAQQRLEEIFLEVSAQNQPALGLYEYFGFRTYGIRPDYYGPGEDALLMKRLSS